MKKIVRCPVHAVCLVICMIIGWPLVTTGQQEPPPRMAIIDFSTTSQEPEHAQLEKVVPEWLTTFFVGRKMFTVIERRQLEAILQEQTLGQTGLLDEQSAAEVGQVLGVDMLVTGTIISVADTLEVTARIVDVKTGTILGSSSVMADDVLELRDEIDTLGNSLINALGKESATEDVAVSEDRENVIFDSVEWGVEFTDDFPANEKAHTRWSQKDGVLSLNGTYTGENEERLMWMYPLPDEVYTSIEVQFRVMEFKGMVTLCAEVGCDNDTMWSAICPYFHNEFADVTVYLKGDNGVEEEEEFEIDGGGGEWHRIRQEYRDGQVYYYFDDRLLTTFSLDTPVDTLEDFWTAVNVYLGETETIRLELDDILVR